MLCAAFTACAGIDTGKVKISALSNRSDKVSGGDVLVAVDVPQATSLGDLTLKLNGSDVTALFAPEPGTRRLVGLVPGLVLGKNELRASTKGAAQGGVDATLQLINHASTGPVFSGPQQQPFYCQTHEFRVYPGGPFLTASEIALPCHVPGAGDPHLFLSRGFAVTTASFTVLGNGRSAWPSSSI